MWKLILAAAFVLCTVLCTVLPARASSISAWRWETLQGLTQQSDTVISGRLTSLSPGDRNKIDGKSTAAVAVAEVFVGDATLAGKSITVEHGAADQPLDRDSAKGLLLFFVARRGANYRLSFFHTFGALPIKDDKLAIWIEGKPHGEFYRLADVLSRVRRYAIPRVEWTATVPPRVERKKGVLVVGFVAKNRGPEAVQLLTPPHYFDALWAARVLDGGKGVSDDWTGISHWDYLTSADPPRALAAGKELALPYSIPLEKLGMGSPGTYRVGVRLEPHRRSDRGEKAVDKKDSAKFWLGGLDQFFVQVVVE
jgi:hypothetical protein